MKAERVPPPPSRHSSTRYPEVQVPSWGEQRNVPVRDEPRGDLTALLSSNGTCLHTDDPVPPPILIRISNRQSAKTVFTINIQRFFSYCSKPFLRPSVFLGCGPNVAPAAARLRRVIARILADGADRIACLLDPSGAVALAAVESPINERNMSCVCAHRATKCFWEKCAGQRWWFAEVKNDIFTETYGSVLPRGF